MPPSRLSAEEILRAASLSLTESLRLELVLERLLDHLGELVPYDTAHVFLVEGGRMVIRAARGYERFGEAERTHGASFEIADHPHLSAFVAAARSELVADTRAMPSWQVHEGAEHVRNWMGVPLLAGREVIGLYGLDKAEPGFFTPEHLRLTEALAPHAVIAIQNARLFERLAEHAEALEAREAEREIADVERQRAEAELRLFAQAVKSITEIVVITDLDNRFLYVNDAFVRTYGYTRQEVLGQKLGLIRAPASSSVDVVPETLAGGWTGEVVNRRKDGSEFPVLLSTSVVKDDAGRPLSLIGVGWDISERKRAEEELRQREQHIARLLAREREARAEAERLRATATALSSTMDLAELLRLILKQLRTVVPYDSASVQEMRGDRLVIVGADGFDDPSSVLGLEFDLDDSVNPNLAAVARGQFPVILSTPGAPYPASAPSLTRRPRSGRGSACRCSRAPSCWASSPSTSTRSASTTRSTRSPPPRSPPRPRSRSATRGCSARRSGSAASSARS